MLLELLHPYLCISAAKFYFLISEWNSKVATYKWKSWYKSLQGFYRNFEYFLLFAIHFKPLLQQVMCLFYEKKKSVVWLETTVILPIYNYIYLFLTPKSGSVLSWAESLPNWGPPIPWVPFQPDPSSRVLISGEPQLKHVTSNYMLLIFIPLLFTCALRLIT